MRKRAHIEIIYDILTFIYNNHGLARSTSILYKTNLSVTLLKKYLNGLINDEMIAVIRKNEKNFYTVTEKGIEFIKLARKINSMTDLIELDKRKREHNNTN